MEINHTVILCLLISFATTRTMEDDPQKKADVQARSQQRTPYDCYQDMGLCLLGLMRLAPANWGDYRGRPNKWDVVANSIPREEDKES